MTKQLTPYQKDALDYTKHISLVANAGSGKTFVLSKRFVEIYKNEEIDLENIVAITFTDKAAGELNKKIADEVEEQIKNEENLKIKKRLEKLSRELVSANISTIHSFCITILKEYAPEAGIDANFYPIDQIISNELIDLSVEEVFQTAIRDTDLSYEFMYLVRILGSKSFLMNALKEAILHRRNILALSDDLYLKSKEEIGEIFNSRFEKDAFELLDEIIREGISCIERINRAIIESDANNKNAVIIADYLDGLSSKQIKMKLARLFQIQKVMITSTENSVRKVGYLNKNRNVYEYEIKQIEKLFEQIAPFADIDISGKSEIELAEFGKTLTHLFKLVLSYYEAKKKSKSYLDFEDILLLTEKIIKKKSVQSYLKEKYKYIMIDEYQDTNELQYDIVMPMLENLKKGNLFVVGDEKQSIYMFRDADLEVFDRTKRDIENCRMQGKNVILPHSFRMYPQLVLFTNKIFKNLFANPIKEFNEVAPSDLICTKSLSDVGKAGVLLADETSEERESELVAKKIIQLINTDTSISFGDIAILCRKRKSFIELESTLIKYQLPNIIMGGKGFYQRQCVYDIYNYLSFLINPKDDSAFLGTLRSPFFNVSDTKLFKIANTNGESFYTKFINYAKTNDEAKSITLVLEENIKAIVSIEPYHLIRKILNESGYWSVLSSKVNKEQETANVEKLLSISRDYANKGFKNLYDFTVALREYIDGYEDEGQAKVCENDNAIKLMTIHQSKGLEFKVVFIYGSNSRGRDENIKSRKISISKEYGILTKVPLDHKYFEKHSAAPITALYDYKSKKKHTAELKRLFYVAVTRAVKYLYISATHSEYKPVKGTFYELLLSGMRNKFENDSIYFADDVVFMELMNDQFINTTKKVELLFTIEKYLEAEALKKTITQIEYNNLQLKNEKIISLSKHEIISATKISMYSQCPVKYELTYEIGYLPLSNLIKKQDSVYEYQPGEEEIETKNNAQIRGKIIHKCLSENITIDEMFDYVHNYLLSEAVHSAAELASLIVTELTHYYKSKTYIDLCKFSNYKNEYEVYCMEGNYFLYGIIDKLIIENDKMIVVDYKTDSIEKDQLYSRSENYFIQLKFYAYVLSKIFPSNKEFQLQIIFIKHPEEQIVELVSQEDLAAYSQEFNSAIKNIQARNYQPNLKQCSYCQYALEGDKCLKQN